MRTNQTRKLLEESDGLFEIVLSRVTTEREVKPYEVCTEMGLAWGGLLAWVNEDTERVDKFKNALEVRAHLLAEDALNIADQATVDDVSVAKLRVDTRKWMASRLNPRWYGEHTKVEHTGTVTNLMQVLSSIPTRGEVDITPQPEKLKVEATTVEELQYHPV